MTRLVLSFAVVGVGLGVAAAVLVVRRVRPEIHDIDTGPASSVLGFVAAAFGILIGFVIAFLLGQASQARQAVGDEATAIGTAFDEAQLFPESRLEIEQSLLCYASAVVEFDWPALQDGRGSPEVDRAYRHLFATLNGAQEATDGTFQPATATNLVAQVGNISTAREVRIVAARIQTPQLLWVLLLFGGSLVIILLFVVTLRAHALAQASLVSVAAVFTEVMLLIVLALGAPFDPGPGRLSPTLIEDRIASMEQIQPDLDPTACDLGPAG